MQMTAQIVITGVRKFKDTVEGKEYDFTKIFTEETLDSASGDAVGKCTVPVEVGTSEVFDTLKSAPFPVVADVEVATVARGGKQVLQMKVLKVHAKQAPKV